MSYQHALAAFEIGRWDLVRKHGREELDKNPENASMLALLAACELNSGKTEEALEYARAAVTKDPQRAYGLYILGLALKADGQSFEGEIALEDALRLEPTNPTYLCALASYQPLTTKKGMELLDQALAQDPDNLDALRQKYHRLSKTKRKREAEEVRNHILQLNPEDAWTHTCSGWELLEDSERHAQALEHSQQAVRLNPNAQRAVDGLLEAQFQLEHPFLHKFNKVPWPRIMIFSAIVFGVSGLGTVFCEESLHIKLSVELMLLSLGGSICLLILSLIMSVVSGSLYSTCLAIYKRRRSDGGPIRWGQIISMVFGVLGFMILEHQRRAGILHLDRLPRWLYSDWISVWGTSGPFSGIVIFAPLLFVGALLGFIGCLSWLVRMHLLKRPKSTQYFGFLFACASCAAILILYLIMALFGPFPGFIGLVLIFEFAIIGTPALSRDYVKRVLRAQAKP